MAFKKTGSLNTTKTQESIRTLNNSLGKSLQGDSADPGERPAKPHNMLSSQIVDQSGGTTTPQSPKQTDK